MCVNVYPFSVNQNRDRFHRYFFALEGNRFHRYFFALEGNRFHRHLFVLKDLKGNVFWRFANVFGNSVHSSNPRTVLSRNKESIMISTPWRFWWKQTFTSRTRPIFISENPPSRSRFWFTLRWRVLLDLNSSFRRVLLLHHVQRRIVIFQQFSNLHHSTVLQQVSLRLRVGVRVGNMKFSRDFPWFWIFICRRFHRNLWVIG